VNKSEHERTLVCLPFAGAGSSMYRSWQQTADSFMIRVIAPQLAGREQRFEEAPFTDVASCLTDLLPRISESVRDGEQLALFGHSLGAILAYELARLLPLSDVSVMRLIVSGAPAPSRPRARRATGLSDSEFVARVAEFAGYEHAALSSPELRELLLPSLRADVEMQENYFDDTVNAIDVPVTAVRGKEDRLVSEQDLLAWRDVTLSTYEALSAPGGHMYLLEHREYLLQLIADRILDA
jgi:surfactin synthase thioesterase subunit